MLDVCYDARFYTFLRRFHVVCSVAGFLCVLVAVILTYLIVPASVRPRCASPQNAGSSSLNTASEASPNVSERCCLVQEHRQGEHSVHCLTFIAALGLATALHHTLCCSLLRYGWWLFSEWTLFLFVVFFGCVLRGFYSAGRRSAGPVTPAKGGSGRLTVGHRYTPPWPPTVTCASLWLPS